MNKLNKAFILAELKKRQDAIVYESDEDEGAADYYAELEEGIIILKGNATDEEIHSVLANLSLTNLAQEV